MKIALLGGYGNAGRQIATILAKRSDTQMLILGRNEKKAVAAADSLAADFGDRFEGGFADAGASDSLTPHLGNIDLLIAASSTSQYAQHVAEVCLETETDYFDIQLSSAKKLEALRGLEERIVRSGRCFITDGGFHPGVPGALIRYAAEKLPPLKQAFVGGAFGVDWDSLGLVEETKTEFAEELIDTDTSVLKDGDWLRGWKYTRKFTFGPPFGTRTCVPMAMEEIREVARFFPTLNDAGFFVAGSGFFLDWVIFPAGFALLRIAPGARRTVGRFLFWGFRTFAPKVGGAELVLEALGHSAEQPTTMHIVMRDSDAYHFTAAPVVEAVIQYMDGGRRPGLWTQAGFVEPDRFIEGLRSQGIDVTIETGRRSLLQAPTV